MSQHNNDVWISGRDQQEIRQLKLLEILLLDFRLPSLRSHRQRKRSLCARRPIT